jgi:hypothetical protein
MTDATQRARSSTGDAGAHTRPDLSRRTFMRRGGGVALGAAVAWSLPSVRSTTVVHGAHGTPSPIHKPEKPPEVGGETAPNAAGAQGASSPYDPGTTGRLPMTGTDPKPLIVTGIATAAAGAAALAIAEDPDPQRGKD